MIRNLILILIIVAMLLTVFNFDLAGFDLKSNQTLIFLSAVVIAVIAFVLVVCNTLKTSN
ncbi:hypothetical protein [Leeuwenhoekiella parthenopeia]|uniref:Uncharacterized protein n=1 Tax=Leeuwenhoekiella parthenopeia TaxID=2890320 RepID=A0ABS8GVE9_9FLAO|nr:hypothetical protein [Leeuwenhoekiella parthenopeia]MCC4213076.1 hypothetical protein [Leeuwenhoekiella parthenopeia]